MVGLDSKDFQQLKPWQYSAAGVISGVITRMLCQPLDVLKIRFQLQIEPIKKSTHSKYRGMYQAFVSSLMEEGVTAFWKGHVPAQSLSIIYGLAQFASFEVLTQHIWNISSKSDHTRPGIYFFCGGISGCIATVCCQPFDVIRTRLVGQGEPKIYRGVFHASYLMSTTEGFFAFYKGLTPTLIQIFPYAGAQFGFYRICKDFWETYVSRDETFIKNFVCGATAGIFAKTVVYPLDLFKKRLQIQGFEKARLPFGKVNKYNSWIDCGTKILKEEGKIGLFKGYTPSLLKAAVTTALSLSTYEQICYLFKKYT